MSTGPASIKATLTPKGKKPMRTVTVPFIWHPGLYHYGINLKLPGDGVYGVKVEVAPPDFMRHDKSNGRRYQTPVTVEFKSFAIKTGKE